MSLQKRIENLNNFTHQDFASVLHRYKYQLNIGDITGGTIFSAEKQGYLVDIGENVAAYLPKDEVSINKYKKTTPLINNSREFFIIAYNKKTKQLILSIRRLEYIRGWQRIKQVKNEDPTINLHINKINKGGLITTLEGIQGFVPNSHIGNIKEKRSLVSKTIQCQLLFVNEKTNTIILSQKRAILKNSLSKLYVGKDVTGIITKVQHYGVFIDICGLLALLHISEINKEDLKNIKFFHVGNRISVQIIHIDTEQGRLSVSKRNSS